jgi:general secretion pathway protein C
MSLIISSNFLKLFLRILTIGVIAKILSIPFYFILPHFGVEKTKDYSINLYHRYRIAKAFGLTPIKRVPVKTAPKKPIYQLTNVKLKAIYSDGKDGVIAIEEKGKLTFLSTGEEFKGYILIGVYPDKAVFEKDGKRYELYLEDKELKAKYIISPSPQPIEEETKFAVLKKEINHYRKNFNEIWKNIAIQEQFDPKTKQLTGFKITGINKNSIFGKIGLKKGDIIIGANNKIFKSYADVLQIYNNIDKYNSLKLTIIRNNEKKDLEYEIY